MIIFAWIYSAFLAVAKFLGIKISKDYLSSIKEKETVARSSQKDIFKENHDSHIILDKKDLKTSVNEKEKKIETLAILSKDKKSLNTFNKDHGPNQVSRRHSSRHH